MEQSVVHLQHIALVAYLVADHRCKQADNRVAIGTQTERVAFHLHVLVGKHVLLQYLFLVWYIQDYIAVLLVNLSLGVGFP